MLQLLANTWQRVLESHGLQLQPYGESPLQL